MYVFFNGGESGRLSIYLSIFIYRPHDRHHRLFTLRLISCAIFVRIAVRASFIEFYLYIIHSTMPINRIVGPARISKCQDSPAVVEIHIDILDTPRTKDTPRKPCSIYLDIDKQDACCEPYTINISIANT